ncbi:hypothetical protein BSKO_06749 [Bryopsis sp. KO-2023]|nr:hypothetical protein BSKO_05639 [Bryopsis sp. KO-2023]GMH38851.1 hypothetical protein BSKO_06749 [Bryopsis sp. KO-2023]
MDARALWSEWTEGIILADHRSPPLRDLEGLGNPELWRVGDEAMRTLLCRRRKLWKAMEATYKDRGFVRMISDFEARRKAGKPPTMARLAREL